MHNDSVDDSNFRIHTKHGDALVDDLIKGTPDYLPKQICKDFEQKHEIRLSCMQAWSMKEKAKEKIHGMLQSSYNLLPWMC